MKNKVTFLISLLFLCFFSYGCAAASVEDEQVFRKRFILYAGSWKTGSSSIDSSLRRNKEALKKRGVFYAQKAVEWAARYRSRTMMGIYAIEKSDLDKLYQIAERENCHTVILMNENAFGHTVNVEETNKFYEMASQLFDVEVTLSVREFYAWSWSLHGESRKWGATNLEFREYVEDRDASSLRYDTVSRLAQTRLGLPKIINYDIYKKHLFEHCLTRCGIPTDGLDLDCQTVNLSFTLSQINIYENLREKSLLIGHPREIRLSSGFRDRGKPGKTFRWYNEDIAKRIYEKFGPHIDFLNKILDKDEQLPIKPFQPEGFVTEWDRAHIEPEDMAVLLDLAQNPGLSRSYCKD